MRMRTMYCEAIFVIVKEGVSGIFYKTCQISISICRRRGGPIAERSPVVSYPVVTYQPCITV